MSRACLTTHALALSALAAKCNALTIGAKTDILQVKEDVRVAPSELDLAQERVFISGQRAVAADLVACGGLDILDALCGAEVILVFVELISARGCLGWSDDSFGRSADLWLCLALDGLSFSGLSERRI